MEFWVLFICFCLYTFCISQIFHNKHTLFQSLEGKKNIVSLNKIIKDVGRMGVMEEGAHSRGTGDLSGE